MSAFALKSPLAKCDPSLGSAGEVVAHPEHADRLPLMTNVTNVGSVDTMLMTATNITEVAVVVAAAVEAAAGEGGELRGLILLL